MKVKKISDENFCLAKIAVEEFAGGKNDTLKRMYNMQSIKTEPLRHVAFTDKRLALSVLNGSNISISDLFQIVKSFDKDFYLNQQNFKRKDDVNMTEYVSMYFWCMKSSKGVQKFESYKKSPKYQCIFGV